MLVLLCRRSSAYVSARGGVSMAEVPHGKGAEERQGPVRSDRAPGLARRISAQRRATTGERLASYEGLLRSNAGPVRETLSGKTSGVGKHGWRIRIPEPFWPGNPLRQQDITLHSRPLTNPPRVRPGVKRVLINERMHTESQPGVETLERESVRQNGRSARELTGAAHPNRL